ncbi:MAG: zinc-ribbon domain-containing protein [Candidatus Thorarchaeota archaeon]
MNISKEDYIPDKIVISVIGPIEIKQSGPTKRQEGGAKDLMIQKATEMGANAIINYQSSNYLGFWHTEKSRYKGTAVIVEDIGTFWKGKECSHCGKRIRTGEKFCGSCGAELFWKGKLCSHCGKQVWLGDKFCISCGSKL